MNLYQWQKECLASWEANQYRGIINVVTGAGKTTFALSALRKLRDQLASENPDAGLTIRVIVPTIAMSEQWKQAFLADSYLIPAITPAVQLKQIPAAKQKQSSAVLQSKFFGSESTLMPGICGGSHRDDPRTHPIMIYVINSARSLLSSDIRREFSLGHHVCLICDECHHYESDANRAIFGFLHENMPGSLQKNQNASDFPELYSCLGLSATPFTKQDSYLQEVLGKEIYKYGFHQASEHGIISSCAICHVSVSFTDKEWKAYQELTEKLIRILIPLYEAYPSLKHIKSGLFMYTVRQLAKKAGMDPEDPAVAFLLLTYQRREIVILAQERCVCCADLLKRIYAADRASDPGGLPPKIIVFCERKTQAEELFRILSRKHYRCSLYHSGLTREARSRVLQQFRESAGGILITCKCLDEGVDVPDARIGIVLSTSNTSRQRIQRLGRILRRSEGKDAALLYYFHIDKAVEDSTYLSDVDFARMYDLHYYRLEKAFSNEPYEHACQTLLEEAVEKHKNQREISELRTCLEQGLVMPDYLLDEETQKKHYQTAATIHARNYWQCMRKIREARQ